MLLLSMTMVSCTFSEGQRSGELVKLSEKGIMSKTWEGELKLGELETFSFTVDSDELANEMKNFMGEQITVDYDQLFIVMPWNGDTNYFIQSFEYEEGDSTVIVTGTRSIAPQDTTVDSVTVDTPFVTIESLDSVLLDSAQ